MSRRGARALAICLLPVVAASARAAEAPVAPSIPSDIIYKGVVGKALDGVRMDPEHRVALQRTNAVVSSTAAGRTLSIWAGLTNPLLMLGGLVWGVFAATNITTGTQPPAPVRHATAPPEPDPKREAALQAEADAQAEAAQRVTVVSGWPR